MTLTSPEPQEEEQKQEPQEGQQEKEEGHSDEQKQDEDQGEDENQNQNQNFDDNESFRGDASNSFSLPEETPGKRLSFGTALSRPSPLGSPPSAVSGIQTSDSHHRHQASQCKNESYQSQRNGRMGDQNREVSGAEATELVNTLRKELQSLRDFNQALVKRVNDQEAEIGFLWGELEAQSAFEAVTTRDQIQKAQETNKSLVAYRQLMQQLLDEAKAKAESEKEEKASLTLLSPEKDHIPGVAPKLSAWKRDGDDGQGAAEVKKQDKESVPARVDEQAETTINTVASVSVAGLSDCLMGNESTMNTTMNRSIVNSTLNGSVVVSVLDESINLRKHYLRATDETQYHDTQEEPEKEDEGASEAPPTPAEKKKEAPKSNTEHDVSESGDAIFSPGAGTLENLADVDVTHWCDVENTPLVSSDTYSLPLSYRCLNIFLSSWTSTCSHPFDNVPCLSSA